MFDLKLIFREPRYKVVGKIVPLSNLFIQHLNLNQVVKESSVFHLSQGNSRAKFKCFGS